MKKFFKKLKDKFKKKPKFDKLNEELSGEYDPEDFNEDTGEYELDKVQFDESTGTYNLEEIQGEEFEETNDSIEVPEELQTANVDENGEDGETLGDLLKKVREDNTDLDDSDDEDEPFEAQTLDVKSLKEQSDQDDLEEPELPDFPETPETLDAPEIPNMPPPPTTDMEENEDLSLGEEATSDKLPDVEEDKYDDYADEHEEYPVEEESTFENIPNIPSEEWQQDLREELTAEKELPNLEETSTRSGFQGILAKLKDKDGFNQSLKQISTKLNSLNLSDQIAKIFSFAMRPKVHRNFIWALCLISSAMIGQIIGSALTVSNKVADTNVTAPPPQAARINKNLSQFDQLNLFKAAEHERDTKNQPVVAEEKPKKVIDLNSPCDSADKESKLPIELTHTVVLQDSVKSIAAVSMRGEKAPLTLREGDKINEIGRIEKIQYQRLVLKNLESGECEFVASDDDKKRTRRKPPSYDILSPAAGKKLMDNKDVADNVKNVGNKFSIKKEERTKLLANIDELLTQALAIQIKNPDGSLSFKMTEIVPGSFYTKMDIQNGDIIKSINGKPITNLNQVMTLFGKINEVDQFQLGILRNGSVVNKEYNFE